MRSLWVVPLVGLMACTPPLVGRAIQARGGPLPSYSKAVDVEVWTGIPGDWSWELAYRVPESFRWSLDTWAAPQRILFDGRMVRHQLGSAMMPPAAADRAVRSQARWFAVTSLDVLVDPRTSWSELPAAQLPPGMSRGLIARWEDDPAVFELFFDEKALLKRARGHVSLGPIGEGLLEANFADYRKVDGFWLPFAVAYRLDGEPLMRESVEIWRPNDGELKPGLFAGQ